MPPRKSKKKAQAGNSRGFATTSVPSKVKEVAPEPVPAIQETIPIADEEGKAEKEELAKIAEESQQIVEAGTKAYTRYNAEIEVDRRSRKVCIDLTLPEASVSNILSMAAGQQQDAISKGSSLASMTALYTGELLLKKTGIDDQTIAKILSSVNDLGSPDQLLYHVRTIWIMLTVACDR